jgi:ABC-type nitrate/sulfonate/bicarbonate transport system substrate-binding protein
MIRRTIALAAGAILLAATLAGTAPAAAQGKKIVVAIPGIPPIYSVTIAFVAEKQGFFKKLGVDVEIRPFDNGTAAARAVVAGDIDMAWSPTPPVINQVSNADVPLVAVYGMPNPDWIIGTTETGKTCKDNLAKNRDAIVRTVAGMIEAARFMQDPKNADTVAEIASITGHNKKVNKAALKAFLDIDFWAAKDDGMPRDKIEAVAALMKKIGSINPDKEPVSYDKFIDASIWKDANAMVK